ncbi:MULTISPECIES: helix-turn-helix transcriptional regulator [Paenibacillus]|uniref:helix-turn-helix transcriptional regulator n=1 Tax=Paenibacillus TaxID=44249 RepID=UPI0022B8E120|nr:helix-turn-helix domain-containing protein [Paenibacillus caseinilyticus]MCZ8521386.1 helix-turn-helix transcriptional regulator [Paenibacillus caseinilyticus]
MSQQDMVSLELPPMPYYITTGLTTFAPGEQHPSRRSLGIFDLLCVVQGELHMGEDGRQWTVAAGHSLLLLPDRYHYAVKPCETETVFYWIHFDFDGKWYHTVDSLAANSAHPARQTWANPYTLRLRQYGALPEFALAERHLRQLLSYSGQHRSAAYWNEQGLFMELLRLLEVGLAGSGASPLLRLAERTEAFLRQHYPSDITNQSLADALHFHPNYIVRAMKEIYHCTPMEYLHEYRLEQAKLLLIQTDWSIAQIADRVGFQYVPYFSSCFKQYAGISPLRFRKQYVP